MITQRRKWIATGLYLWSALLMCAGFPILAWILAAVTLLVLWPMSFRGVSIQSFTKGNGTYTVPKDSAYIQVRMVGGGGSGGGAPAPTTEYFPPNKKKRKPRKKKATKRRRK